ncbi:MAG: apolipoprotein N-acyltransferase [Treponema sp.]|nr:apolipoprotein N-acyltransferase [Treponema sp.]
MTIIFQVFCALFSGILTALAIPNELYHLGSTSLAFAALVPLYIAAKGAFTYKRAALVFALDALSCHLLSSYWLANFKDFAVFTLGASAFGTACIEAMAGCLFVFPFVYKNSTFYIEKKPFNYEPYRVFHFALVRVIYEWAKSTGFLAYPWGVLPMAAFDNKILAQSADIFGVYGLTFMMAFGAGTLAEFALLAIKTPFEKDFFAQSRKSALRRNAKCLLAMLSLAACYGTYKLGRFTPEQKTLNAVLVQQNKDPWASSDDTDSLRISMKLSEEGIDEFLKNGERADLVVWSEAVLRYGLPHSLKRYTFYPQEESLFSFIQRMDTPFIIGGPYIIDATKNKYANAALVFDRTSSFKGYYGKSHLVPFAEVIPGVEYPWVRNCMDRMVGFSNGWTAGGQYRLFEIQGKKCVETPAVKIVSLVDQAEKPNATVRIASPICFEDAFPDVCGPFHKAGAEVFMNITDDSWSKTDSAEWQHFAVASFRAIEYRTTLVRATNAGLTAVVDNKGRVLQSLPLFKSGYLNAKIPIYERQETVYSEYGNWFVHSLLILAALLALLKAREFRRPPLRECVMAELEKIEF